MKFKPKYTITPKIAQALMRIEAAKQAVADLPITPAVLARLHETAQLFSTHYSTQIEGNRLTQEEVIKVIQHKEHFPGRQRDEGEVKGYYAALGVLEQYVAKSLTITEKVIQTLHALVMADERTNVKPTPYRDGQNVIRNSLSGSIVYMPPKAKDVPELMKTMAQWIKDSKHIPCPIIAGTAHYQFATIHPYYDGNGRTARLLTTLILHLGGYGLKGIYCLEEYYAKNLAAYYEAISVGPSHNYYMGRAESDITKWVEYFCTGMAESFEKVKQHAEEAANKGSIDQTPLLRKLDPKQRKVLELFREFETVTAKQIGNLFGFKSRTSSELCRKWVKDGFIVMIDSSRRGRKYQLVPEFMELINK